MPRLDAELLLAPHVAGRDGAPLAVRQFHHTAAERNPRACR
jgi:hypothetical protein